MVWDKSSRDKLATSAASSVNLVEISVTILSRGKIDLKNKRLKMKIEKSSRNYWGSLFWIVGFLCGSSSGGSCGGGCCGCRSCCSGGCSSCGCRSLKIVER